MRYKPSNSVHFRNALNSRQFWTWKMFNVQLGQSMFNVKLIDYLYVEFRISSESKSKLWLRDSSLWVCICILYLNSNDFHCFGRLTTKKESLKWYIFKIYFPAFILFFFSLYIFKIFTITTRDIAVWIFCESTYP